jgi:hypothetical protein
MEKEDEYLQVKRLIGQASARLPRINQSNSRVFKATNIARHELK